MPTHELSITSSETDQVVVLELSGMLGLRGAAQLVNSVSDTLRNSSRHVVVCDLSGLQVPHSGWVLTGFPAGLRRTGGWPNCALHLAAPSPALADRLASMRMHRYLPIHPTLSQALAAAREEAVLRGRRVPLPPVPISVRRARAELRELWPAESTEHEDEALVVLDELAANAVQHVAEPFTVSVTVLPRQIVVAVDDASRQEPILRRPLPSSSGGRGMHLVAGLSQHWGVRLVHPQGKTVWASFPVAAGQAARSSAARLGRKPVEPALAGRPYRVSGLTGPVCQVGSLR